LQPKVPRDLETICLKCLQKEPHRRFPTADALADDLRRFLDGEPIAARPVTFWERGIKWARRRPAVAGLLATVVAVTALGFGLVSWQLHETDKALAKAQEEERKVRTSAYFRNILAAYREWRSGEVDRAESLLDECSPEMRRWEWYYLKRLCHTELANYPGHTGEVLAVAASRDGVRLASADADGTVRIWETGQERELFTFTGHTGPVRSVAFSPDGQRLASAGDDGFAKVWDLTRGQEVFTLAKHPKGIRSIAYGPDGKRLATGGEDKAIRLWDATTGQEIVTLGAVGEHTATVNSVAFSRDGQYLASASSDGSVRLWDTKAGSGARSRILRRHTDQVTSVTFSPNGQYLASASTDKSVILWNVKTLQAFQALQGHTREVTQVAFDHTGRRLASASLDRTIKFWESPPDSERPGTWREVRSLRGHTGSVQSLAFSPVGARLVSGGDKTVRLWDTTHDQEALAFSGQEVIIYALMFNPVEKQFATANVGGSVSIWNADTGRKLRTFQAHKSRVYSLAFRPDGKRLASASADGIVKVLDPASGQEDCAFPVHRNVVTTVAFHPDGSRLASAGGDLTIRVWDAATGRQSQILKRHTDIVSQVVFSPDGRYLASASYDRTVRLWDLARAAEIRLFRGHTNWVHGVAFSPNGQYLASCSTDETVRIWDTMTGAEVHLLRGHTAPVWSVTFTPDGERLVSASLDKTVRLWDVVTGLEVFTLEGHTSGVHNLAFSRKGLRLASVGVEGMVRLWEAPDEVPEIARLPASSAGLSAPRPSDDLDAAIVSLREKLAQKIDPTKHLAAGAPMGPTAAVVVLVGSASPPSPTGFLAAAPIFFADQAVPLGRVFESLSRQFDLNVLPDFEAFAQDSPMDIEKQFVFPALAPPDRLDAVLRKVLASVKADFVARQGLLVVTSPSVSLSEKCVPPGEDPRLRLREKLATVVNLDKGIGANTPLKDVLEFLTSRYKLTIVVDTQAFKAIGIQAVEDWPVRLPPLRNASLTTVLVVLTSQINGSFLLRRDYIEITTSNQAQAESRLVSYPSFQVDRSGISTRVLEGTPTRAKLADAQLQTVWTAEAVRAGRIRAPDLRKLRPLLDDDFRDPTRGFAGLQTEDANQQWKTAYENGRYIIHTDFEVPGGSVRPKYNEWLTDFACQVTASVSGQDSQDGWGLMLDGPGGRAVSIKLNRDRTLEVGPCPWTAPDFRMPRLGPLYHPAIREGDAVNSLLVVVRGSRLEIYVNDVAVCEPIYSEESLTPTQLILAAIPRKRPTRVEFQHLTIWPADGQAVPP
jgi:WD40 repeat protein